MEKLYKLYKLICLSLFLLGQTLIAQSNSGNFWQNVDESQIVVVGERIIIPQSYRTIKLNLGDMHNILATAPLEFSNDAKTRNVILSLPFPDGSFQQFSIFESPIMESELAIKFPEIKTYIGKGIDDKTASVRFDLTPHGFHAMILCREGNIFIDPYSKGDKKMPNLIVKLLIMKVFNVN
jgi:hypothetical protein